MGVQSGQPQHVHQSPRTINLGVLSVKVRLHKSAQAERHSGCRAVNIPIESLFCPEFPHQVYRLKTGVLSNKTQGNPKEP